MGLDNFMGAKKTSKKSKKKSSKKKTSKSKSKPEQLSEKEEKLNSSEELKDSDQIEETTKLNASKFTMITVKLSCDSKCGYKKTLKRPKSFVPKEKDLKCPKCGKQMKIKK